MIEMIKEIATGIITINIIRILRTEIEVEEEVRIKILLRKEI